jgi:hypothetical protein
MFHLFTPSILGAMMTIGFSRHFGTIINGVFTKDGLPTYGCRGIGLDYDAFYAWLKTTSAYTTSDDWPWHYFRFKNPEDETEFLKRYDDGQFYFDKAD